MKYIPLFIIFLIILSPGIIILSLRKTTGLVQWNEANIIYIYSDKKYESSFISPKENLNSITLKFYNLGSKNIKPLYFELAENDKIIRTLNINGMHITDRQSVRLAFPLINDSKNKLFKIILNSPESNEDDAVGIFTDDKDRPVMVTYHHPSSKIKLIEEVYKNTTLRLAEDKLFIAIWLILLGSMIVATRKLFSIKETG